MKINFNMTVEGRKSRVEGTKPALRSPLAPRPSTARSGIALVITLILLSVTLVMAVAFLAISNRERSSVTTTTDSTTARLAAETALAHAEAQIISTMLATTNPYNYGLLVSTNYINPNGFVAGLLSPTNVNYDYYAGGGALNAADLQNNLANLFLSPRVPVFIATNGGADFRFYLDLNRSGRFEDTGLVNETNNAGFGTGNTIPETGDPQWIGVLERPDTTHGPNNKFLSRYAFIAIPVGNTLDINYIHNQANSRNLGTPDGYLRNEGVGSWEINLAAFLADLNTNQWDPPTIENSANNPYQYNPPPLIGGNTGAAFEDARALLAYRYNDNYNTLALGASAFLNNGIDEYADGNLMTNTFLPFENEGITYWAGSDNTNHFFTLADLFNSSDTAIGVLPAQVAANDYFTGRLLNAGNGTSTYDRYTFYRMLSQLGTDTEPESGLMNLNYDNLDPGLNGVLNVNGTASVTNYVPWTPINFFTNAADRMLRLYTTNWFLNGPSNYLATYYGITNYPFPITVDQFGQVNGLTNFNGATNQIPAFGVTSIPVLVNGQFVYSPAVNRILQLAANMYDATTNRYYDNSLPLTPLPTVFKPVFDVLNTSNVYITNFVEVTNTAFFATDAIRNINYGPAIVAALQPNDLVFGVPLIIGAKKGFPNFNEFYMENTFQLTRKLLVTRQSTNVPVPVPANFFSYYEQFSVGLSNQFGVEMWNSYRSNYTRPTDIYVTNYLTMLLTNDESNFSYYSGLTASGYLQFPNFTNTIWSGYNSSFPINSFQIPMETNFAAIPGEIYRFNNFTPPFLTTNQNLPFDTNYPATYGKYPQPHWGLTITNNLQVIMVDANSGRIIDYVQLGGPNTVRDLTAEIQQGYDAAVGVKDTRYNNQWNPNLTAGTPIGISEQLNVSQGLGIPVYDTTHWGSDEESAYDQMNGFLVFNGLNTITYPGYPGLNPTQMGIYKTTNQMDAAYTPTATVVQDITWQANDPLVHYIASDLNSSTASNGLSITPNWPGNLGKLNQRYMPWGGNPLLTGADQNPYNLAIKDPLIYSSDNWDFPSYKFPTVGWLGRVHRGTPWQTVYLKASQADIGTWTSWTGNINTNDAINTLPTIDHLLFDLFTTAPNDNATHGQLSVNVDVNTNDPAAGLAAWSALFSGIVVPTSLTNTYTIINPAGAANVNSIPVPPLLQLVTNINFARAHIANRDGLTNTFEHVGSILTAPQLTEQSPFLAGQNLTNGVNDELMEWLPQQMMSLLRAPSAPRYVIYCYGQALKPAPNSIITGGTFFQMCTNYQVVTESAARAVIRVEGANTPSPHIVVESFNLLPPD
jgi:hypothetical protein